ncbi:MAG: HAD family phosphatase [Pseudomonadota bacterium]
MNPSIVVFDIGGVLVDWKPHLAWTDDLGSHEAVQSFMKRVDFMALNKRGDNGETFADLSQEVTDPADAALIAGYVDRYSRTVETPIAGTWELLDRLKDGGVPIHAITNWSAETWAEGLKVQPRLGEVFGTLVVSGREGIMKPDARIFELLCSRAGVAAADCVFTDDSMHNVEGARAAGMDAIHFTGPETLETALVARRLL